MNCGWRDVPVPTGPVFTVLRIWPKVAEKMSVWGSPYWFGLIELKASTRNGNCVRSFSYFCFGNPRLVCHILLAESVHRNPYALNYLDDYSPCDANQTLVACR